MALRYCPWHSYDDAQNTQDQTEESPGALNLFQISWQSWWRVS